jgi:ferredoxin-NADP reductase
MNIKLIHKEKIAADSWELIFEKPEGFVYEPGQFLEVYLDHPSQDDRGIKRWFTMSSSPTESDLMITTRLVEKHSSFKEAFFKLKPGDELEAKGPMGSFIMPKDVNKKIIWIAGGIGITPFRSQMKFLLDNQEQRSITLIYSNRTINDVCFSELWENAKKQLNNFHYVQTLVDEIPENWTGEKGVIDAEMIKRAVKDPSECEFYVSGPEPMVEAFKPMLLELGAKEEVIHQDWFPNYTDKF